MLDEVDRRIIGALHTDPRASWDDVAAHVGVTPSTVSRRFARLHQDNILRVVGEVDWSLYSSTFPVHLRIQIQGRPPADVAAELATMRPIQYLALTYGRYPLFATVHSADEHTTGALLRSIYELDGVASVITLPVLGVALRGSQWYPTSPFADPSTSTDTSPAAIQPGRDPDSPRGESAVPKPDSVDKQALALLQHDGRAPASKVSGALGLANTTSNRMVRRYLQSGWFRPRVEVDGAFLGYEAPFILRAKASHANIGALCRLLAAHPATRFVTQVASEYNVVCLGLARDRGDLARVINEDFGRMDGIRELDVDLCISEPKRFWLTRDQSRRLGDFEPPALL